MKGSGMKDYEDELEDFEEEELEGFEEEDEEYGDYKNVYDDDDYEDYNSDYEEEWKMIYASVLQHAYLRL